MPGYERVVDTILLLLEAYGHTCILMANMINSQSVAYDTSISNAETQLYTFSNGLRQEEANDAMHFNMF
jgi:hypothetical protein